MNHEIVIIVVDVNDNAPFFETSLYEVKINEVRLIKWVFATFSNDFERNYYRALFCYCEE